MATVTLSQAQAVIAALQRIAGPSYGTANFSGVPEEQVAAVSNLITKLGVTVAYTPTLALAQSAIEVIAKCYLGTGDEPERQQARIESLISSFTGFSIASGTITALVAQQVIRAIRAAVRDVAGTPEHQQYVVTNLITALLLLPGIGTVYLYNAGDTLFWEYAGLASLFRWYVYSSPNGGLSYTRTATLLLNTPTYAAVSKSLYYITANNVSLGPPVLNPSNIILTP